MTIRADLLARFTDGAGGPPPYLPDLTLWYGWHRRRGSLPYQWQGQTLPQIARAMGAPIWLPVCPWRVEYRGAQVVTTEQAGERVIRSQTAAGTLVARWILGPGDDWWQTEYPVKTADDLPAALALVQARHYVFDPSPLSAAEAEVGEDGIVAVEIPRRPYSDLLHELLGWQEGLMLMSDGHPATQEILDTLEEKLRGLMADLVSLPAPVVFSPDNLDGQYVSPAAFHAYLAGSYGHTVDLLHGHGKILLVHAGGALGRLPALLAGAGVDGIEGVAGSPQDRDALARARELAGPQLTLWGGIPQDYVLPTHDLQRLEDAVGQAVGAAREDGRLILGVADRVPVDADPDRLAAIPALVAQAGA